MLSPPTETRTRTDAASAEPGRCCLQPLFTEHWHRRECVWVFPEPQPERCFRGAWAGLGVPGQMGVPGRIRGVPGRIVGPRQDRGSWGRIVGPRQDQGSWGRIGGPRQGQGGPRQGQELGLRPGASGWKLHPLLRAFRLAGGEPSGRCLTVPGIPGSELPGQPGFVEVVLTNLDSRCPLFFNPHPRRCFIVF